MCVWKQLNNHLFEELAMDVYDEVDRRENDAGKIQLSSRLFFVPSFLSILSSSPIMRLRNDPEA